MPGLRGPCGTVPCLGKLSHAHARAEPYPNPRLEGRVPACLAHATHAAPCHASVSQAMLMRMLSPDLTLD